MAIFTLDLIVSLFLQNSKSDIAQNIPDSCQKNNTGQELVRLLRVSFRNLLIIKNINE